MAALFFVFGGGIFFVPAGTIAFGGEFRASPLSNHPSGGGGDYQIAPEPLLRRGFGRWRLAPPGDGFPRQCEHWLGMTALRAGGAVAGRRTPRHLSLRGAKRRGNPLSYTWGTDSHASDVGHWLGMTEGCGSPRAQSALGMTARGGGGAMRVSCHTGARNQRVCSVLPMMSSWVALERTLKKAL